MRASCISSRLVIDRGASTGTEREISLMLDAGCALVPFLFGMLGSDGTVPNHFTNRRDVEARSPKPRM